MRYRPPRQHQTAAVGIIRNGMRFQSHLVDLSERGMKLKSSLDARPGEVLQLHAKGAVIQAEVRWVRDNHIGLQFAKGGSATDRSRFLLRLMPEKNQRAGARVHGFTEL
ncbi:PilZ domain-containing protein [Roseinatronobacter alkalisoli]|uniref:PilZ domain-containing protein n=1 Tax=Roseinatronobacter alkalisoli TaxID=3028235 RepID=A0ABT5T611_9RHOB|nr:PilZ domain-containing protein [Roseinatronobacter sp. HJB301]MDD7970537.1 PilZ domain-containing protein [Roseinatronobacter sp. HJB301]